MPKFLPFWFYGNASLTKMHIFLKQTKYKLLHPTTTMYIIDYLLCAVLLGQLIQLTALQWMKTFLELAGAPLLPFTANILTAILPCLSYDSEKMAVKHVASEVNQQLKLLITPENDVAPDITTVLENTLPDSTSSHGNQSGDAAENGNHDDSSTTVDTSPLNMVAVLEVLLMHMNHRAQDTRIEALTWLLWLHKQVPRRTYLLADKLFPSLMNLLSDNSDKVCVCVCVYMFVFILNTGGNT